MDPALLWAAAFGPKHLALDPAAWTLRTRSWKGILHVVATAKRPRFWYRFHAVWGGRRGLRMARAAACGDTRQQGVEGSWWVGVPIAGWSRFGLHDAPEEWHPLHPRNLSPMAGWGRAKMDPADVWGSLIYSTPQAIQSTFGPLINMTGRRVMRAHAKQAMEETGDSSPPPYALCPSLIWQPTAKPRLRRWLNGLRRSRNAREREQAIEDRRQRREGHKVH